MMFLAFSKSKIFAKRPDTVIVDESDGNLMFDLLIVGIETLAKGGTVLGFQEHTIQINHEVIAMRPYTSLAQKYHMRVKAFKTNDMYVPPSTGMFARDNLDKPSSTQNATKRALEILDADYEKANIPEVTKDTCGHLSSIEHSKLLRLLTKYEELFDGTLVYFDTDPVRFDLRLGTKAYHGKLYPVPQSQKAVFKKKWSDFVIQESSKDNQN